MCVDGALGVFAGGKWRPAGGAQGAFAGDKFAGSISYRSGATGDIFSAALGSQFRCNSGEDFGYQWTLGNLGAFGGNVFGGGRMFRVGGSYFGDWVAHFAWCDCLFVDAAAGGDGLLGGWFGVFLVLGRLVCGGLGRKFTGGNGGGGGWAWIFPSADVAKLGRALAQKNALKLGQNERWLRRFALNVRLICEEIRVTSLLEIGN